MKNRDYSYNISTGTKYYHVDKVELGILSHERVYFDKNIYLVCGKSPEGDTIAKDVKTETFIIYKD